MSSRFTLRAKPALFSFLRTDSTATPASFFSGVTSVHATRNPDNSSHANNTFAMSEVRATPVCVAWPRMASSTSSGQPAARNTSTPWTGCSSAEGWRSQSKSWTSPVMPQRSGSSPYWVA